MIDHFNLPVSNVYKSLKFYCAALEPLGYKQIFTDKDAHGFGKDTWQFGIYPQTGLINVLHVAFVAQDHEAVKMFHLTALKQGGQSNGSPALRVQYGENYFAAYILDLDGHNIEAVCRV